MYITLYEYVNNEFKRAFTDDGYTQKIPNAAQQSRGPIYAVKSCNHAKSAAPSLE